ncbi:MAG: DNA-processing protein DprA [Bacteroidetes bacterium]|nr:DNA-processing protein DprA [Bacteroidota bacterium]
MNPSDDNLLYRIALSLIPGIGCVTAKKIVAYVGSVEGVFREKKQAFARIPGVGEVYTGKMTGRKEALEKAEKEIQFIRKYAIGTYFYLDKQYPARLKHCNDAPVLLYYLGNPDFSNTKTISIVGTRSATSRGKEICTSLVRELAARGHNPMVVSGLAYGIDVTAHKAALENNLQTVAVLGHGLDKMYPSVHSVIAKNITDSGGLITEFASSDKFDKQNFLRRNRIIAGLADAVIVVESGLKGGALVTADIASSYNRDVFAVPGRIGDRYSAGCNRLIKTNKAALIENADDLEYQLGWERKTGHSVPRQKQLFVELSDEEKKLFNIISEAGKIEIDRIGLYAELPVSKVSYILLNLEFKGLIKTIPGNMYTPMS